MGKLALDSAAAASIVPGMSETDFSEVLNELDALETELEAIRVAVDEGDELFVASPTARQSALRHLETAVRHTVESARALIGEADWEEPEDALDAIEILVEEDVLPGRIGQTLVGLAEFAAEHNEETGWDADADPGGAFERLSESVEALTEYQEYVGHFLKEWHD
jgi:uncharacterized protein YutE (UPF0331/DUF86 family)